MLTERCEIRLTKEDREYLDKIAESIMGGASRSWAVRYLIRQERRARQDVAVQVVLSPPPVV